MSESQNRKNMGDQFRTAFSDAISTGDFTDLNDLIVRTFTDTLNDAGKHFSENLSGQEKNKSGPNRYMDQWQRQRAEQARRQKEQQEKQQQQRIKRQQLQREAQIRRQQQKGACGQAAAPSQKNAARQETGLQPVKFKEIGSVSGTLYQIFGGIGLGITSVITLLHLLGGILFHKNAIGGWIVNIAFLALFFFMIKFGSSSKKRLQRARRYIHLCGSKMYCQIESLARDTGKSIRYVTRDLRKMLRLGMFPEGHLDDKKTCLMLDDKIHKQYLELQRSRQQLESEEAREQTSKTETPEVRSPKENSGSSICPEDEAELNTMIAEGMECIARLRELNDCIPGEVISEKLYQLENLLKDIFNSVREHPEQMHRMHSMMDYYLPTTLKLVESYRDFDKISSPGKDVTAAKEEIERTLDIINRAFAELLENLFQDAVFDATTDAQVLKTMLARDGLTGNNDFSNNKTSGGNNQ